MSSFGPTSGNVDSGRHFEPFGVTGVVSQRGLKDTRNSAARCSCIGRQIWPGIRANSDKFRPESTESWANSADFGRHLPELDAFRPILDRIPPMLARFRQVCVESGPNLFGIDRLVPKSGPSRPNSVQHWPKRPQIGEFWPTSAEFAKALRSNPAEIWPKSAKFGRNRVRFGRLRATWSRIWPNLGDNGMLGQTARWSVGRSVCHTVGRSVERFGRREQRRQWRCSGARTALGRRLLRATLQSFIAFVRES